MSDRPARPTLNLPRLACAALGLVATGPDAAAAPDTFLARLEALASMETLNADILASRSATRTLQAWCAVHRMAPDPKITAVRMPGAAKAIDDAQRRRLAVTADEPIRYRHVRLTCGGHILSEADNWYVPSRLTPAMNKALDTTDVPFGLVVAPLHPTRETFAVDVLWTPLPAGWQLGPPPPDHAGAVLEIPPVLFEHHAVLFDGAHQPFAEVDEHYTRDILSFGTPR